MHLIGNPGASSGMWIYTSGTVQQVYRARVKPSRGVTWNSLRVESQLPSNYGDSGGPVVDDWGRLIAVHHASQHGESVHLMA